MIKTYPNPNVIITKLFCKVFINDEYEHLKDNKIFAIAEDIYYQINRKGFCKENQISIQRLKTVCNLLHSIYYI